MARVLRTEADPVFADAAFEIGRAADVEGSVGAEKNVCVSHDLILSATTDSFPWVELVEGSAAAAGGCGLDRLDHRGLRLVGSRVSVIELVEMT